jgi:hypothetical protein
MGNASEIDLEALKAELEPILVPGETVELGFQIIRDQFLFTNKRFVLIDRQGMTGKKVDYLSIPYRSITKFSLETAGRFDLDAELKIWVSSNPEPIAKQLKKGTNIAAIQKALALGVLG